MAMQFMTCCTMMDLELPQPWASSNASLLELLGVNQQLLKLLQQQQQERLISTPTVAPTPNLTALFTWMLAEADSLVPSIVPPNGSIDVNVHGTRPSRHDRARLTPPACPPR